MASAPHLKKLDDRSKALVYFGVEDGSKAHRLYDPRTNRIVISRDVVFEESKMWEWSSALGDDNSVDFDVVDEADAGTFVGGGVECT